MKITEIRPLIFNRFLLARVYTDSGIVGTGEAGNWAHHRSTYQSLCDLADYFVGKDPLLREHHYQTISRRAHFMGSDLSAALSAVDVALWDILGKLTEQPVFQLLGGKCREKAKAYTSLDGETRDAIGASAQAGLDRGFSSFRMTPFQSGFEARTTTQNVSTAVRMVANAREILGDEVDLGLEIHRNLKPDEAILLGKELESFKILYFEDPVAPESVEALEYVANHVDIPIATGERFYNIFQFKDLIDRKIVSLIRPDLSLVGGFTQLKKIAAIAEAAFVGVFPHLMGTAVNTAAFTQMAAAIPNFCMMEANDGGSMEAIVGEPVLEDGYRVVPERPGIGMEIDEAAIAAQRPFQPIGFDGPIKSDGSVAH